MNLSNLKVQNGGGKALNGGGILNYGILSLTNCNISGNTANFYGGGIFKK